MNGGWMGSLAGSLAGKKRERERWTMCVCVCVCFADRRPSSLYSSELDGGCNGDDERDNSSVWTALTDAAQSTRRWKRERESSCTTLESRCVFTLASTQAYQKRRSDRLPATVTMRASHSRKPPSVFSELMLMPSIIVMFSLDFLCRTHCLHI